MLRMLLLTTRTDVVKSWYALEWVVGQVLGDFAGLFAVLLVCSFASLHDAIASAVVVVCDCVDVDIETPLRRKKTVRGVATSS